MTDKDPKTIEIEGRLPTPFEKWLEKHNGITTLEQQIDLARQLYDEAVGPEDETTRPSTRQLLRDLEQTPIQGTDTLVTWTGIQMSWFVNVFYQTPFIQHLKTFGCQLWFVRKVCIIEMIRRTKPKSKNGSSQQAVFGPFVKHLGNLEETWNIGISNPKSQKKKEMLSKPTIFLSYTGAYTLDYLLQVLVLLKPEEYIWMDIFCVDQFAWTGKGRSPEMHMFRDSFMDELCDAIAKIGKTALVLEKWDNVMVTLGQIWVLWEVFNTTEAGSDLKVLLPPGQVVQFVKSCLESAYKFDSIEKSLSQIDAHKARAQDENDRALIFERMERVGLSNVTESVIAKIREWLIVVGERHLSELRELSDSNNFQSIKNMGRLLQHQGKLDEAEPLFLEALEYSRKHFGADHLDTIQSVDNLGRLLQDQGKLDEAAPLLREGWKGYRNKFGKQDPTTLGCLSNLACVLCQLRENTEAEELCEEALEAYRQQPDNQDANYLSFVFSLANTFHAQQNWERAEPLLRDVLERQRKLLGDQHAETLSTISGLAGALTKQGKFEEAEPLCIEALEGKRRLLGSKHPYTLNALNNFGALLVAQGKLEEAEPMYQEALHGYKQELGLKHPTTILCVNNLSRILISRGNQKEAEALLRQILDAAPQQPESFLPTSLADCNKNMGQLLFEQGKYVEAEPFMKKTLEAKRGLLDNLHEDTLSSLYNVGLVLINQGKLGEAKPFMQEALDGQKQVLGNRSIDTLDSTHNLALLVYNLDKDFGKAEILLQEAVAGYHALGLTEKEAASQAALDALRSIMAGEDQ